MILIRAALIKILKTAAVGALSLAVLVSFLLTYSYLSGDRQDRVEMVATAEHALAVLTLSASRTGSRNPASAASLVSEK